MKILLIKFLIAFFFVVNLALAMEDEETSTRYTQAVLPCQKIDEKDTLPSSIVTIENLSDELLSVVFRFLEIPDLGKVNQVSARWRRIAQDTQLWRFMGVKYYGDFLSPEDLSENPKQKVIYHYLCVIVNSTENLQKIDWFVSHYQLNLYAPLFKKYLVKKYVGPRFLTDLVTDLASREEFVAQGNETYIERKLEGLLEINSSLAKEFNERLINKGNQAAIERRIWGLLRGENGYERDHTAVKETNELLVEKGDLYALKRKRECLLEGECGYEKNPAAAKEVNELLVEKGDLDALRRKREGLLEGEDGYEKNPAAAKEVNELLVEKGDFKARQKKSEGLAEGKHGYEKDPVAAEKLENELFALVAVREAIEERLAGLLKGEHGYKKNPAAAKEFNELLIEKKGDPEAIERKVEGLAEGKYEYEKSPVAAREFNDSFVEKGNPEAIKRKIEGLAEGKYGYKKCLTAAREFNDSLIEKGNLEAIERKIRGHAGGEEVTRFMGYSALPTHVTTIVPGPTYGYQKDPAAERAARKLKIVLMRKINDFLIEKKGDPEAIQIKIEGVLEGAWYYEKNMVAAREFIERLVTCEFPVARAIGKYLKAFAMKYGVSQLGYKKDRVEASKFIKEHHVPY